MKKFFFVFKYNFRRTSFNNFIKVRNIKNFRVYDLSGPLKYYSFGKFIIFFVQKFHLYFKNCVLISCDAEPILFKNSINLWFGGTSYKVPQKFKKLKNNSYVFENFKKKEQNLIKFYPHDMSKFYHRKEPKVVFIGEFTDHKYGIINKIWNLEKKNIFKNFKIIDNKNFWKKYNLDKNKKLQPYYIALKDLLRLNLIIKLNKVLKNDLIIVGNKWKPFIKSSLKSNYDPNYSKSLYKGNICIDFGTKWGSNCLYPRSINIIENGGLLLQSLQSDTKKIFQKTYNDISFNSFNELLKKIKYILNDSSKIKNLYNNQYKNFNKKNLNYKNLQKVFTISKKNN